MTETKKRYRSLEELPDFCTVDDLSQVLGVSKSTTYRMIHIGSIPCLRIGKRVILSRDHLIHWVNDMLGGIYHV